MGILVADLMESIAGEYSGDARIGVVAVVVEVEGDDWTQVRYRCSDGRSWVQEGFFRAAQQAVTYQRTASRIDDDEDDD